MKLTCCPSCKENFTLLNISLNKVQSRQPLILRCGHTFCEVCLAHRTKKTETVVPTESLQEHTSPFHVACSTCQHVTSLENGIKDLPVNVYLTAYIGISQRAKLDHQLGTFTPSVLLQKTLDAVEDNNANNKVTEKCNMCHVKDSTCKCIECESVLCFSCFDKVHKISASIKQHKPVPLKADVSSKIVFESTCGEHNRPIEYYCEEDSSAICSRCYILGSHKNHPIVSFEEKNKQLLPDIENELPNASLVLNNLRKVDKKISSAFPNVKAEAKSVIDHINQSFLTLHSMLQIREMELLDSLSNMFKESCVELKNQKQFSKQQRLNLDEAISDAKKLIDNSALVIDGNSLLDALKGARSIPCIVVKKDVSSCENINWEENNIKELITAVNSFGRISGKVQQKIDFKTIEEAPEEVEEDDRASISSFGSSLVSDIEHGSADVFDEFMEKREIQDADPIELQKTEFLHEELVKPVVKGPLHHSIVTHIRSPNDFYVQLTNNKNKLDTLSHNINTWCRKNASLKHAPIILEKHMNVLARYSVDKLWYRAKVLNVEVPADQTKQEGFKIRVMYIDFGNEENVTSKDLRLMEKRFLKYPPFAIRCSLYDFAPYEEDTLWSVKAIQEFHQMTQNKAFLLSALNRQDEIYEVDLIVLPAENVTDDGFISLRDIMVFLELGRFRTFSDAAGKVPSPPAYPKIKYIKPTSLMSGKIVDVTVTCVNSPLDFYLVRDGVEKDYYQIMFEKMQETYSKDATNIYSLFYPRPGMVCAVKDENSKWYRGEVLAPSEHRQVKVKFVDVGAVEIVQYEQLKKLHSEFFKLPIQAVCCKLADVCPVGGLDAAWSDEAEIWFQNVLSGTRGCVKVVRWAEVTEMVLWLGNKSSIKSLQSVNCKLVEMGLAQSTGLASVSAVQESYAIGLDERDSGETKASRCEGSYPEASSKAKVMRVRGTFSDKEASHVHTKNRKDRKKSTSPYTSPMQESTSNTKLSARSAGKQDTQKTGPSRVKQQSKTLDATIQKQSSEKEKIQRDIQRAMSVNSDDEGQSVQNAVYIEVVVCNYKSPSDFFIRIQEKEEELSKLMEDMQKFYTNSVSPTTHQWKQEEYCAAKYSVDELWYRCNIKTIENENCQVDMVDYGYSDLVKCCDLRCLNRELGTRLEVAAVRCHLADLVPSGSDGTKWPHTATDFMMSIIQAKKLYIKQEGELKDNSLPIDIIYEEVIPETAFDPVIRTYHSLRQSIIDNGLAMPMKRGSQIANATEGGVAPFHKLIFEENMKVSSEETEAVLIKEAVKPVEDCDVQQEPLKPLSFVPDSDDRCSDLINVMSIPASPVPEVGTMLRVVPTFISSSGAICSQPVTWTETIVDLEKKLVQIYGTWEPKVDEKPVKKWKTGDTCVAPFDEDKLWYRAVIKNISSNKAEVFYIDFGNSSLVNVWDLCEIHPDLYNIPVLSYCFYIHDLEPFPSVWERSALEDIHRLVIPYECAATVRAVDENNLIMVDLIRVADGLNLKDYLVSKCVALCKNDDRHIYTHSSIIGQIVLNIQECPKLKMGNLHTTFRGLITHVERPDVIYLQRSLMNKPAGAKDEWNQRIKEFEVLMENLNSSNSGVLDSLPIQGTLVEGQYTVDDRWYRAVVVMSYPSNNLCLVTYFDFGTTEILPLNRMRPLHDDSKKFPIMAWRCHLAILPPKNLGGKWTNQLQLAISNLLMGKEVIVRMIKLKPRTVELFEDDTGEEVLKKMFQEGLAQPADLQNDVVSDNEELLTEKMFQVGDIECRLTEAEVEEIEMLVSNPTLLKENLAKVGQEKPFWTVGYESLLTEDQRKEMVNFLARKVISSKLKDSPQKVKSHIKTPGNLDSPSSVISSDVTPPRKVEKLAVKESLNLEVVGDVTASGEDDDAWTTEEEETDDDATNSLTNSRNDGSSNNLKTTENNKEPVGKRLVETNLGLFTPKQILKREQPSDKNCSEVD